MADFLDEVAQYLDDQGVGEFSADAGRTIFVNHQPSEPDFCISLFGNVGETLGDSGRDVTDMQFPRFQVLVRGAEDEYALASSKMQAIRTALHGKLKLTLPSWRILRMHADQDGGPIGTDEQGRPEFSINFTVQMHAD